MRSDAERTPIAHSAIVATQFSCYEINGSTYWQEYSIARVLNCVALDNISQFSINSKDLREKKSVGHSGQILKLSVPTFLQTKRTSDKPKSFLLLILSLSLQGGLFLEPHFSRHKLVYRGYGQRTRKRCDAAYKLIRQIA